MSESIELEIIDNSESINGLRYKDTNTTEQEQSTNNAISLTPAQNNDQVLRSFHFKDQYTLQTKFIELQILLYNQCKLIACQKYFSYFFITVEFVLFFVLAQLIVLLVEDFSVNALIICIVLTIFKVVSCVFIFVFGENINKNRNVSIIISYGSLFILLVLCFFENVRNMLATV